jgi:amino acid transporter
MSAVAANYAREKKWTQAKMWAGITAGIALALVILTLFIVVKSHTGASEATAAVEEFAFGVMISFILMMIAMIGISVMSALALVEASKENQKDVLALTIGASGASFIAFILSLVIIIFLL